MQLHGLFSSVTPITVSERMGNHIVLYLRCSETHGLVFTFYTNCNRTLLSSFPLFTLPSFSLRTYLGAHHQPGNILGKDFLAFLLSGQHNVGIGLETSALCFVPVQSFLCDFLYQLVFSPKKCRSLLFLPLLLLFKLNLYKS